MNFFKRMTLLIIAFSTAVILSGQVMAQSSQDMELLTEAEQHAFFLRLQKTMSSAGRAKLTAEMNRVVQERRLELRKQERAKESK